MLEYVRPGSKVVCQGRIVTVKDCFPKPEKSKWPEHVKAILQLGSTCVAINDVRLVTHEDLREAKPKE